MISVVQVLFQLLSLPKSSAIKTDGDRLISNAEALNASFYSKNDFLEDFESRKMHVCFPRQSLHKKKLQTKNDLFCYVILTMFWILIFFRKQIWPTLALQLPKTMSFNVVLTKEKTKLVVKIDVFQPTRSEYWAIKSWKKIRASDQCFSVRNSHLSSAFYFKFLMNINQTQLSI